MRVSIVVCNYNYAEFLDDAIRCAVEQDFADKEVIVVDDGSDDGSREIIARWGHAIVPIFKANAGQVSAYNAGFERVTGDLVVFLDSDDLLDRNACTRIVEAFDDGIVKVHGRLRLIGVHGDPLGPAIPDRLADGETAAFLRKHGKLYDSAPGSGNAYRVATLRKLMPLPADARDKHGADFFTIYGTSVLGRVRALGREPIGSYRVHRTAATPNFGNAPQRLPEPERTYARYRRLKEWLNERLGLSVAAPRQAPNFSLEKQGYVRAIFSAASYGAGVRAGWPLLVSKVLPAVGRVDGSIAHRAALACWAVSVLVLPRDTGLPLARYGCDPASR